ncbi:ABC transporter permease, partial [Mesorhizobium sp. M7A.F.Ca.CA.001.13.2.1]
MGCGVAPCPTCSIFPRHVCRRRSHRRLVS